MIVSSNRLFPIYGKDKNYQAPLFHGAKTLPLDLPDKKTCKNNNVKSSFLKTAGMLLSFLTAMSWKTNFADNMPKWELDSTNDWEISLSDNPVIVQVPRLPSHNIGWNDNIKVLAARGQEFRSNGSKDDGSYYQKNVIDLIRQKKADNFEEANNILEKQGYLHTLRGEPCRSFPTSTPRQLDSWKISDKTPERYVLLLGQQLSPEDGKRFGNQNFNTSVTTTLDNIEKLLREPDLYNLPASSIQRFDSAKCKNISQWIEEIQKKIQNKSNVELLIYYNGHGECLPDTSEFEGDVEGKLLGPQVWEINLKRWINEAFGTSTDQTKPPKVLLIMDTCFAGAWIA